MYKRVCVCKCIVSYDWQQPGKIQTTTQKPHFHSHICDSCRRNWHPFPLQTRKKPHTKPRSSIKKMSVGVGLQLLREATKENMFSRTFEALKVLCGGLRAHENLTTNALKIQTLWKRPSALFLLSVRLSPGEWLLSIHYHWTWQPIIQPLNSGCQKLGRHKEQRRERLWMGLQGLTSASFYWSIICVSGNRCDSSYSALLWNVRRGSR